MVAIFEQVKDNQANVENLNVDFYNAFRSINY